MDERNYILTATPTDTESARLALLEQRLDPLTIGRLNRLDIAPGSRCLEVGAGRGSIARWLADQVGTDGQVVAADIDVQHLTGLPDTIEVRALDIRTDRLEPNTFDLVHCRALLMHLPDPLDALRRMVAALRPGGALLAEEGDYGLYAFSGHPDAPWLTDLTHKAFAGLAAAKIMNPYLGRTLPGMLTTVGLELAGGEIDSAIARSGEPAYEFERLSAEAAAPAVIAAGIMTDAEHQRAQAVRSAPAVVMSTASLVAAWGRRTT
jgi:SAM-dependent methyltransferase